MKPLQLTDGAFFISSSFIESLEVCARKSEFTTLEKRISSADSDAIHFGSTIHSALNMYHRQQEFELSKEEIFAKVVKVITDSYANKPESDDFRNLNWCITVYQKYVEKFEFEEFKLLEYKEAIACPQCASIIDANQKAREAFVAGDLSAKYKNENCEWCCNTREQKVMVEVPFAAKLFDYLPEPVLGLRLSKELNMEIGFIPIYYRGFIDLPISINNRVFVLDFKTTSMLGDSFWDSHKMSAQQKSYAWGLAKTTNLDVAGYMIRAIRTTPPPQWVTNGTANKKGEFKKIADWWNESLVEQKWNIDKDTLTEWERNTIAHVKTFFYHYGNGYFPQETTSCVGKFGKCQYFDVCSTVKEDRETVLYSGLYKDKEDVMSKL